MAAASLKNGDYTRHMLRDGMSLGPQRIIYTPPGEQQPITSPLTRLIAVLTGWMGEKPCDALPGPRRIIYTPPVRAVVSDIASGTSNRRFITVLMRSGL